MNEKLENALLDLMSIKKQQQELEEREKAIKEMMLPQMKELNLKKVENEVIQVIYKPVTSRESVDSAKLKKDFPDIANQVRKISEVKESLQITLKKEND